MDINDIDKASEEYKDIINLIVYPFGDDKRMCEEVKNIYAICTKAVDDAAQKDDIETNKLSGDFGQRTARFIYGSCCLGIITLSAVTQRDSTKYREIMNEGYKIIFDPVMKTIESMYDISHRGFLFSPTREKRGNALKSIYATLLDNSLNLTQKTTNAAVEIFSKTQRNNGIIDTTSHEEAYSINPGDIEKSILEANSIISTQELNFQFSKHLAENFEARIFDLSKGLHELFILMTLGLDLKNQKVNEQLLPIYKLHKYYEESIKGCFYIGFDRGLKETITMGRISAEYAIPDQDKALLKTISYPFFLALILLIRTQQKFNLKSKFTDNDVDRYTEVVFLDYLSLSYIDGLKRAVKK